MTSDLNLLELSSIGVKDANRNDIEDPPNTCHVTLQLKGFSFYRPQQQVGGALQLYGAGFVEGALTSMKQTRGYAVMRYGAIHFMENICDVCRSCHMTYACNFHLRFKCSSPTWLGPRPWAWT